MNHPGAMLFFEERDPDAMLRAFVADRLAEFLRENHYASGEASFTVAEQEVARWFKRQYADPPYIDTLVNR